MIRKFYEGFTVYSNGENPVYVCPHSGPALISPKNRDENSETVASLCFEKTGGSLVISNMPRKRNFGIDFNRDLPSQEHATMLYPEFMANKNLEKLQKFKSNFAFAAMSKADYMEKVRIFRSFWTTVGNLGSIIVFFHRKYSRVKNYPSIIDIVTYEGRGVDTGVITEIVDSVNLKYDAFLDEIKPFYTDQILMETKRILLRLKENFKTEELKDLSHPDMEVIANDLEILKKIGDPKLLKEFLDDPCHERFYKLTEDTLSKPAHPKITIENIFKGRKALSQKEKFFNNHFLIMEAEINSFMSFWFPEKTAEILMEIVSRLQSAKLYRHLGIAQTHVTEFFGKEEENQ